ncbi:uracil-DNA glycosylase, partial [bacterium]|nr:uracil-DNA glycosylase [bacterium]
MSLQSRPSTCIGCVLHDNRLCTGFASPFGTGSSGVMVIAEALGEWEARESRPLVPKAQAGSVFARALRRMALDEQQFVIINAVNCRPQGNRLEGEWYEEAAISHCKQYVDRAIERFQPRAIVALGNVSLRAIARQPGTTVTALRGYCLPAISYQPDGKPIPVVPSYHPSFISRGNERLLGVWMHDIGKAIKIASGKLKEGIDFLYDPFSRNNPLNYVTRPSEDCIRDFLQKLESDLGLLVAYDIETSFTKNKGEDEYEIMADDRISQIQFSLAPGTGIALPWNNDTFNLSKRIFAGNNPKAGHNAWRFDNPILRSTGISINGTV